MPQDCLTRNAFDLERETIERGNCQLCAWLFILLIVQTEKKTQKNVYSLSLESVGCFYKDIEWREYKI